MANSTTLFRILFFLLLVSIGCKNTVSRTFIPKNVAHGELTEETLEVPADSSHRCFDGLRKKESVLNYYHHFGPKLIWITEIKTTALADSLILLISNAPYYGLIPNRYHITELESIGMNSSPSALVRRELLLTDAFLCLAADLEVGLLKSNESNEVDSTHVNLLRAVIHNGKLTASLKSQEPVHKGYHGLKHALAMMLDSLKTSVNDSIAIMNRVRLVSINLERWRAEGADLRQRHIFINIPSYTLDVVDNDSIILSSRVIVGTRRTETPIISSSVECFTIYPYWHVPRKIATEEYLPLIKSDTSFIVRNNFDVLDRKGKLLNSDSIDWNKFNKNYFPVSLRQRQGTDNSLGVIKFIFDNPYAVFLHDTNAKRLFRERDRAFSHGCVRMEKAVELAHYLATERVGGESRIITKYLNEEKQHWVNLKRSIPIYTRYFTCEFRNGVLHVYKDVYQKDQILCDLVFDEFVSFDL